MYFNNTFVRVVFYTTLLILLNWYINHIMNEQKCFLLFIFDPFSNLKCHTFIYMCSSEVSGYVGQISLLLFNYTRAHDHNSR